MKRRILYSIIISALAALVFCAGASAAGVKTECIVGDVTGDGYITVEDARIILRTAVKLDKCPAASVPLYDTDANGEIGVSDARLILRVAVELDPVPAHLTQTVPGKAATCLSEGVSDGLICTVCGKTVKQQTAVPETAHSFLAVQIEPTCASGGFIRHECIYGCGEYYDTDPTPALPHKWDEGTVLTPVTCTTDGLIAYSCLVCDSGKEETVPATGHTVVTDEGAQPTCVKDGITEGSHCRVCGEIFVAQKVIPATGHTEVISAGAEPTCTRPGYTEGITCSVCGEIIKEVFVIKANGHTLVEDPYTLATCTETGLTGGKHCSVCGYVEISQKTVPAKGHKEAVDKGYAPTCTKEGRKDGTYCTVCNTVIRGQEVIPPLGHTEKTVPEVAPGCTVTGLTSYIVCTVCKENVTEPETRPSLGHDEQIRKGTSPTCTQNGTTDSTYCARCNKTLTPAATIVKLGHDYKNSAVAPTCTKDGYDNHECRRCSYSYKDNYKDKLGHDLSYEDRGGKKHLKTCSRCDLSETVACDFTSTVKTPNCTEGGYTDLECKYCSAQYRENVKSPLGHKGKSAVKEKVSAVTCTKDGYYESVVYCTRCEAEMSRTPVTVTAPGHTPVTDAAVAPGCVKTGLTEGSHCSVCGEIITAQETVAATGHSFGEWTHGVDDDFENIHTRACSACDEKETAKCTLIAEIVTAPTETEDGVIRIYCPDCGFGYTVPLPRG